MSTGRAYYNENDKQAANWLRELMREGLIAPGVVDDRSIHEIEARDLRGFAQCHFFAGIGGWSHALRLAGWPDDEPVWTGSCPCQPFSSAGKGEGFADARHLWPVWFRLIRECGPHRIFGEQVDAAVSWIDLVSTDLEGDGYAFGAPDLPAAGFGGAHIRQRLYWMADANNTQWWADRAPWHDGEWPQTGRVKSSGDAGGRCAAGGLVYPAFHGVGTGLRQDNALEYGPQLENAGVASRVEDAAHVGREGRPHAVQQLYPGVCGLLLAGPSAPSGADWLLCRDGRYRPTEPGSSPLVDEAPARMATLRGYGNCIDAETAANFIAGYMAEAPQFGRAAA